MCLPLCLLFCRLLHFGPILTLLSALAFGDQVDSLRLRAQGLSRHPSSHFCGWYWLAWLSDLFLVLEVFPKTQMSQASCGRISLSYGYTIQLLQWPLVLEDLLSLIVLPWFVFNLDFRYLNLLLEVSKNAYFYVQIVKRHLHLVILRTLLSKATYIWGIHKAIHLKEANRQSKCS